MVGYFNGIKSFSYERVLDNELSIQATYAFGEYTETGDDAKYRLEDFKGRAFPNTNYKAKLKSHSKLELRYYLSHERNLIPAGFHLGVGLEYNSIFESFYNVPDTANVYGTINSDYSQFIISVNFGPQILISRIVALDIGVSPGIVFQSGTEVTSYGDQNQFGSTNDLSGPGFSIAFTINAGIAFGK